MANDETMRADAALAARGLAPSRERGRALIEAGLATVNGQPIDKPSRRVIEADLLAVIGDTHPYVSRGGLKLEKALRAFEVDVNGRVCVDVGASTGGFTDVLLRNGARHVFAVDVGTAQLHESLRGDPRVTSMERVNARGLTRSMFDDSPTLAVMDVSFISIKLILPALFDLLGSDGRVISLVKPQFEAGRRRIGKNGIVSKAETHRDVLKELVEFTPSLGWRVRGLEFSPIAGGDGNLEFLADIAPEAHCDAEVKESLITEVVRRAHASKKQGQCQ